MGFLRRLIFGPSSPEELAQRLVKKISTSAFKIFRDEQIREMLNFSRIDQIEQDRMFNEFVVTGMSLAILMFETVSELTKEEKSFFYQKLGNQLRLQYLDWLDELGIAPQYVEMWGKLIDMRLDEYRQDFEKYRKEVERPEKANPWISITAIGGLHHLRRGKTSPEDPLFKHVLAWLTYLALDIEKVLLRA